MMHRNRFGALIALVVFGAASLSACKSTEQLRADANRIDERTEQLAERADNEIKEANEAIDEGATRASLMAAIASESRPIEQRSRDLYRHPYETLDFFGVRPDSAVLELWPGGSGWYTHILGPYVGATGKLYVTNYSAQDPSEYRAKSSAAYVETLKTIPNHDRINVIEVIPPETIDLGLDQEVDFVLTFRNIHNWMKDGSDVTIYEQAYKALKPGGIFGVVEHRGQEGMTREQSIKSGYVDQQQLISEIEAAGFELVEASEINANAKDTKDHPEGVWTLPPSMRLEEKDATRYMEIGESDRMTLKFKKPAAS